MSNMAFSTWLLYLIAVTCTMVVLVVSTPHYGPPGDAATHHRTKLRVAPDAHRENDEHAVAQPIMHPHRDHHHAAHLTPTMNTTHWYSVVPAQSGGQEMHVRINMSHNSPVVVLDHSLHVSDVQCANGTDMTANFLTDDAYQHAKAAWPKERNLVAVTRARTCSSDGQNAFHRVHNTIFNDANRSVRLKCEGTHVHNVAEGYQIEWGKLEEGGNVNTDPDSPSRTTNNTIPIIPINNATTNGTTGGTTNGTTNGTVLGFTSVAPGWDFDQRLDNALGYYSLDNLTGNEVLAKATGLSIEGLQKRGLFDFIGSLVDNVVRGVQNIVNTAVGAIRTVLGIAKAVVSTVVNVAFGVVTLIATGQFSARIDIPVDQRAPDNGSPSPFSTTNNYRLFQYRPDPGTENYTVSQAALAQLQNLINEPSPEPGVDVWCVDCRFKGNFQAFGIVQATLSGGVQSAFVRLSGTGLEGNLGIGVDAFARYNTGTSTDLLVYPLGGWSVPNIVVLGPRLVLSATTDLTIEAMGQLYVAYNLKWQGVTASYDFKLGNQRADGWTPVTTSTVRAAGSVAATLELGLPMKLNFNLEILNTFGFSANVSNVPALVASANLSLSNDGSFPCQGVGLALDFVDSIQIGISGLDPATLAAFTAPVTSTCVSLPTGAATKQRRGLPAPPQRRSALLEAETVYPRLHGRQANANQSNDDPIGASAYPVEPCDIWDLTRSMQMHPHVNGNLFLNANTTANVSIATGGNTFYKATSNNTDVVWGDKQQRVLHYYPETLAKLGVSRLRLATWQNLPKGSHVITMATVPTGNGTERMLMGVDPQGNYAWIYCCAIENEPNKMFLASNWTTGGDTLQSPEMQSIVTGGPASACLPIAMRT